MVCPLHQAVALIFTLWSSHPGGQAMVTSLFCLICTAIHLIVRPLRVSEAQTLQTILLLCLTGVSIASTPYADAVTDGVVSQTSQLTPVLLPLLGLAIPFTALAWAYCTSCVKRLCFQSCRCLRRRVSRELEASGCLPPSQPARELSLAALSNAELSVEHADIEAGEDSDSDSEA
jgi:hypothetical protein